MVNRDKHLKNINLIEKAEINRYTIQENILTIQKD